MDKPNGTPAANEGHDIAAENGEAANTGAAENGAAGGEDKAENLRAELDALRAALKEAEDKHLRVAAEAENIRKRAEEEVRRGRKFALEAFAGALLEVDDCLEMAQAGEKDGEGVRLTLRKLRAVFERFEVRPIAPQTGADFDPALHTAMGVAEGKKQNTIAAVVMKGYTLSGRVLRPAGVMVVGKAQSSQTSPAETESGSAGDANNAADSNPGAAENSRPEGGKESAAESESKTESQN